MKTITFLYLEHCPYCRNARKAMEELKGENAAYVEVLARMERIEESKEPEKAVPFGKDYYYVPTMFVDGQKFYEAKPGESYEDCKEKVKAALQAALAE